MNSDISWYEEGHTNGRNQPSTSGTQSGRPPDQELADEKPDTTLLDSVNLADGEDDPEEAVNSFHSETRKGFLPFTGVQVQDEFSFLEAIKQFRKILEERVEILTFRRNLKEILYKYLIFFGTNFQRISIAYVEEYLDVMEDILVYYCDVIREYFRDRKRKEKKTKVLQEARRVKILFRDCLMKRMDRILHVLLKVKLAPEIDQCVILWGDVYVYFLTKVPCTGADDDLLRRFIVFQKLKTIRAKSEAPMIDKLITNIYKVSYEEMRGIPCLGEIIDRMRRDKFFTIRDMVTHYMRYYTEKRKKKQLFGTDDYEEDADEISASEMRRTDLFDSFSDTMTRNTSVDSPIARMFADRRRGIRKTVLNMAERDDQAEQSTGSYSLFGEDVTKEEAREDEVVIIDDADDDEDDDVILVCDSVKNVITIDDDDDDAAVVPKAKTPPPRELLSPEKILVAPPDLQSATEQGDKLPPANANANSSSPPETAAPSSSMEVDDPLPPSSPSKENAVPEHISPSLVPKDTTVSGKKGVPSVLPTKTAAAALALPARQVKAVDNTFRITINSTPSDASIDNILSKLEIDKNDKHDQRTVSQSAPNEPVKITCQVPSSPGAKETVSPIESEKLKEPSEQSESTSKVQASSSSRLTSPASTTPEPTPDSNENPESQSRIEEAKELEVRPQPMDTSEEEGESATQSDQPVKELLPSERMDTDTPDKTLNQKDLVEGTMEVDQPPTSDASETTQNAPEREKTLVASKPEVVSKIPSKTEEIVHLQVEKRVDVLPCNETSDNGSENNSFSISSSDTSTTTTTTSSGSSLSSSLFDSVEYLMNTRSVAGEEEMELAINPEKVQQETNDTSEVPGTVVEGSAVAQNETLINKEQFASSTASTESNDDAAVSDIPAEKIDTVETKSNDVSMTPSPDQSDPKNYSNITEWYNKFTDELSVEDILTSQTEDSSTSSENLALIDLVPGAESANDVIMVKCRPIEPLKDEEVDAVAFTTEEVLAPSSEAIALLVTYPGSSEETSQQFLMCRTSLTVSEEQVAIAEPAVTQLDSTDAAPVQEGSAAEEPERKTLPPRRETVESSLSLSGSQPYTPQSSPSTRVASVKHDVGGSEEVSNAEDRNGSNCNASVDRSSTSGNPESSKIKPAGEKSTVHNVIKPGMDNYIRSILKSRRASTDLPKHPPEKDFGTRDDMVVTEPVEGSAENFRNDLSQSVTAAKRITPQEVDKIAQLPVKFSQQPWDDKSQQNATMSPYNSPSLLQESSNVPKADNLSYSANAEDRLQELYIKEFGSKPAQPTKMQSSWREPQNGVSLAPPAKTGGKEKFAKNATQPKDDNGIKATRGRPKRRTSGLWDLEAPKGSSVPSNVKSKLNDTASPQLKDSNGFGNVAYDNGDLFNYDMEGPVGKPLRATDAEDNFFWDSDGEACVGKAKEDASSGTISVKPDSQLYQPKRGRDAAQKTVAASLKSPKAKSVVAMDAKNLEKKKVAGVNPPLLGLQVKLSRINIEPYLRELNRRQTLAKEMEKRQRQLSLAKEMEKRQRQISLANEMEKRQRQISLANEMKQKQQQCLQSGGKILVQIYSDKSEAKGPKSNNWFSKAKAALLPNSKTSGAFHVGPKDGDYLTSPGKGRDQSFFVHKNGHKVAEKRKNRDFEAEPEIPRKRIAVRTDLVENKSKNTESYGTATPKLKSIIKSTKVIDATSSTGAGIAGNDINGMCSSPTKRTKSGRVCKKPRPDYDDVVKSKIKVKKSVKFNISPCELE